MSEELGAESSQQDVNTGESTDSQVEASSTETAQDVQATPPAEESSASDKSEPKTVPYDRFKEVIDERNRVQAEIRSINERLAKQESERTQSQTVEKQNKVIDKLVSQGVDKQVAKLLADTMGEVADERVSQRVAPVERAQVQREIDSWLKELSNTHKDFKELSSEMEKVYAALPEHMQSFVVSDKLGLEMLYSYAKAARAEEQVAKAKQAGRDEAYKNVQLKSAVSGAPNSAPTPNKLPTEDEITAMSMDQYKKLVTNYPGGVDAFMAALASRK